MLYRSAMTLAATCLSITAQGNYEIQRYGSDTVPPIHTMVELHSENT